MASAFTGGLLVSPTIMQITNAFTADAGGAIARSAVRFASPHRRIKDLNPAGPRIAATIWPCRKLTNKLL